MKYQDLKVRDAGRLALIGLGSGLAASVCIAARASLEPIMSDRFWSTMIGVGIMSPIVLALAIWYLVSSPEQDAKFLRWAERLGYKPGPKFDPALLDPADPDYAVATFRYWIGKQRRTGS